MTKSETLEVLLLLFEIDIWHIKNGQNLPSDIYEKLDWAIDILKEAVKNKESPSSSCEDMSNKILKRKYHERNS